MVHVLNNKSVSAGRTLSRYHRRCVLAEKLRSRYDLKHPLLRVPGCIGTFGAWSERRQQQQEFSD